MRPLPKPIIEKQMAEILGELENAIAASEWEGTVMTLEMRALLRRYALGEITATEFRNQVGIAIAKQRLDLCH